MKLRDSNLQQQRRVIRDAKKNGMACIIVHRKSVCFSLTSKAMLQRDLEEVLSTINIPFS